MTLLVHDVTLTYPDGESRTPPSTRSAWRSPQERLRR